MLTQKDETDDYYSNMTIHPLCEKRINMDPTTIYQFLQIIEKKLDERDKQLDLKCFPDLFCYGENGKSEKRPIHLHVTEFIKCLLKLSHSQFRQNLQYVFFLLNNANIRQLRSGIFHKLNITNSTANLTAKKCLDMIASKELEGNLSTIFKFM